MNSLLIPIKLKYCVIDLNSFAGIDSSAIAKIVFVQPHESFLIFFFLIACGDK